MNADRASMTCRRARLLAATTLLQILAGCVTLTSDPRAIFLAEEVEDE